jgi:vesicular inhibitory amino acid transporter
LLDSVHCNHPHHEGAFEVSVSIFREPHSLKTDTSSARPLIATAEVLCGLDSSNHSSQHNSETSGKAATIGKVLIRIFVLVLIVFIAIVFPSFDRIMALMGSLLCFTICIILPLAFYLKIFGSEISLSERIFDWFLVIVSSVMAIVGTTWAFLPFPESGTPVVS